MERPPWIVRLIALLRPREGWLVFAIAWAAVLCLPAAVLDANWLPGLEPGVWLATLGLVLAWRLGHVRRLHGLAAAALLAVVGVLADLVWGVYALNVGLLSGSIGQLVRYAVWWLGPQRSLAPAITYPSRQWGSLVEFAGRVAGWVDGLTGRRPAFPDNLVLDGLALLLLWAVACWAGWWFVRRGRPFEALLPSLALMAVVAFVFNRGPIWLLCLIVLLPPLLALERVHWLAERWETEGVDYSPEMKFTAAFTGIAAAVIVLLITPTVPFLTSRQVADAFWHLFEKPYRQVEQRVNESFPVAPGARSLVPPNGVDLSGLPHAHLIGGRPELGNKVSLRVTVRGAEPGDVLYWRGQTFSNYDGHGWETDAGSTEAKNLGAGQPWLDEQPAGRHSVLAYVDVYAAALGVLYGPGEPISADRPYQALERAAGELIQLSAPSRSDTYTVLGSVPDLNANALRASGSDYPQVIRELYLGLPQNIPPEVAAYAAQTTAGAATPYDAAIAIERTLRQIPYTLDVPPPPKDRELVSWFLFDLKRGYCDYYATAMVVLARERGIPARLAVGYATGNLDPQKGYYQATELQAHSWPELYFPRLGWIPFEPTGSEPVPARAESAAPPDMLAGGPSIPASDLAELTQRGQQHAADDATTAVERIILAILNAGLLVLAALSAWARDHGGSFASLPPGPPGAYARLARWGARLGRPAAETDTPREYAAAVTQAAEAAARRPRRQTLAARRAAEIVASVAPRLVTEYELAEYAGVHGEPPAAGATAGTGGQVWRQNVRARSGTIPDHRWDGLWTALRRLWIARKLGV